MEKVNKLKKECFSKNRYSCEIVIENINVFCYFLLHNFINSLSCSTFPYGMKYEDVTPIHKMNDKSEKENYP